MSNPYILELHGPAASKVTSPGNQTIRELETIIESFTAENMELRKKLNESEENQQKMKIMLDQTMTDLQTIIDKLTEDNVELQEKLNKSEENQQRMKIGLTNMIRTQVNITDEFNGVKEFDGSEYPQQLDKFFYFWGFKEREVIELCKYLGVDFVENMKCLKERDWEPGGDMNKINFLSDTKINYLKWLWEKVCGRESRLNPDIIQEIVQNWRCEVLRAYMNVHRLGRDTHVF